MPPNSQTKTKVEELLKSKQVWAKCNFTHMVPRGALVNELCLGHKSITCAGMHKTSI